MQKQGTINEQYEYWIGQKKSVIQLSDHLVKRLRLTNKFKSRITINGNKVIIQGNIMNKLVQAAMEKRGLTQASLAKDLGKPPETLNRWLKNKQQASKEDIIKLAEILKLPPGVVQFEPEPIAVTTIRGYLKRDTELLKTPEMVHLPTNFPSFFEGQHINTNNPTTLKYGSLDLFDMQNKNKCIDERCINAWSILGAEVDGKEKLLSGRLMPRADGSLFDVTGMWEVSRSSESNEYKGVKVNWACPMVVQLQKQFLETYTSGEKNNYSNQGYTL
tara:strand:- start:192 stop:1013 length:822 start_codon:yes stop_codon:yes gene_type:complete